MTRKFIFFILLFASLSLAAITMDSKEVRSKMVLETEQGYDLDIDLSTMIMNKPNKWLKVNGTFATNFSEGGNQTRNQTGRKYFAMSVDEPLSGGYVCYRDKGSEDEPGCLYKEDFAYLSGPRYGFNHIYHVSWENIPDGMDKEFQIKLECSGCTEVPKTALIYFGSGSTALVVTEGTNTITVNTTSGNTQGFDWSWDTNAGGMNTLNNADYLKDWNGNDIISLGAGFTARYLAAEGGGFYVDETAVTTANESSPAYVSIVSTRDAMTQTSGIEFILNSNFVKFNSTDDSSDVYALLLGLTLEFDNWLYGSTTIFSVIADDASIPNSGGIYVFDDTARDTVVGVIYDNTSCPSMGVNTMDAGYDGGQNLRLGWTSTYVGTCDFEYYIGVFGNQTEVRDFRDMIRYPATINATVGTMESDGNAHLIVKTANANISSDFWVEYTNDAAQGYNRTFLIQTTTNKSVVYVELDGTPVRFTTADLITYTTTDALPTGTAYLEVVGKAGYDGQDIIGKFNFTKTSTLIRTSDTVFELTPPTWNQTPTDQTVEYSSPFSYQVNASDDLFDAYGINDTTNFKINSATGLIENNTFLALTEYSLNVTANDTEGAIIAEVITITVEDTTAPTWNQTPTDQAIDYAIGLSYRVNASDLLLDTYLINDTTNFKLTGNLIENATTLSGIYSLNVSVNDTSGNTISQIISVTSTTLTWLINCSLATDPTITLGFTLLNETNDVQLVGDTELTFDVWNTSRATQNFSFVYAGLSNFTICIQPRSGNYTADMTAKYSKVGYSTRYHYLDNAEISNDTTLINLYLTLSGETTIITVHVKDASNKKMIGAIVEIYLYDVGENTYTLVEVMETDLEGKGTINIVTPNSYRFVVKQDGKILHTFGIIQILSTTTTITLRVPLAAVGEFFDTHNQISGNCLLNNVTDVFSCSYVDTSGVMREIEFEVQFQNTTGYNTICNATSTATSGTFTCTLPDTTADNNYRYTLLIHHQNTRTVIANGYLEFHQSLGPFTFEFGTSGTYMLFIATMVSAFVFIWYPPLSIVMLVSTVAAGSWLRWITISRYAIIGLAITGAVVIFVMERKEKAV